MKSISFTFFTFTHISLDYVCKHGHSDHSFLFQLLSAMMRDAATPVTNRILPYTTVTSYSAGNLNTLAPPVNILSTSCYRSHQVACPRHNALYILQNSHMLFLHQETVDGKL